MTLAELKAHCRVDVPDSDADLAAYLLAAREWVEGETRRCLLTQTWDFTYDRGWPYEGKRIVIRLPLAPVQSITSVSYVDDNGVTQVLSASPTLYQTVLSTPNPRIERAYNTDWPSVRDQPEAITVRAVCGYGDSQGDVPHPLRLAIKLLVGHWYENRGAINIGNIVHEIPLTAEALISPYRRAWY